MGKLHIGKLHRERVVTGRIFQALPTQTDTTIVAYIYKVPILQIPRRGGYSTYQIPAQHCLYNCAYIIEISVKMIPCGEGGGGLLSTPTCFSISKNIVNLQSNEILFNIKNITCWKAKD